MKPLSPPVFASNYSVDQVNTIVKEAISTQREDEGSSAAISASTMNSSASNSSQPQRYKAIIELYAETQPNDNYEEAVHLTEEEEPQSSEEVLKIDVWKAAMMDELKYTEKKKTWSLITPPKDSRPLGLKWVFKLKKNLDGTVIKYKD